MTGELWEKVEQIFHAALNLPSEDRKLYLERECDGDADLVSEVESLLQSFERDSDFLDEPVFELGLEAFNGKPQKNLTGSTIGFYQLRERIGAGGMGEVYQAFDTRLSRRVALKFLNDSLGNDKTAKHQLVKEAQAVARLEHSNICAVYDIVQSDEHHFIVMQYIDGETLGESAAERNISVEEFKSIARQIVTAVAYAHSHGVLHRDLKPGNIMLTSEGQIKVLDFGLAKIIPQKQFPGLDSTNDTGRFSQNGLIIGTVSYMSPEQLRGEKLDYRSDIFAVGIILYELLAKEHPFSRKSQAETIAAVLDGKPSSLHRLVPDFPANLVSIVEKCLAKDRDQRFQSAAEMLVELDKTGSENLREIASKRRLKFYVKTAFAAAILIAVLTFAYFYGAGRSPRKIAVLPISFEVPQAEKEYLAYGLTQGLIDKLSHLSDLNVKNESLTARYRDKLTEPRDAGKELNVDAVLTGIIKNRAGELVLETRLIRTSDGVLIDSFNEKIDETKLIELPESIASRIIGKIQTRLTDEDKNRLQKRDTESEAAKNLYFEGRFYLKTKKGNDYADKAIQAFTNAKDLDLHFAKAWAGLADAYLSKSGPGVKAAIKPQLAAESAKMAANRAVELDNTLCEAYNSLGLINLKYEWNWREAESNFRTAINCDTDLLPAYFGLINVLIFRERFDEALAEAAKIKGIDPFSVSSDNQIAQIYYRKRDYGQVDKILSELLPGFPGDTRLRNIRVYQFLITGQYKEAVEILEPVYRSEKEEDRILAAAPLGFALAKMGRSNEALKIIEALGAFKDVYVPAQEKSLIYVGLGDYDKAFENLNKSCDERFGSLPGWVGDPLVDEVKSDPRFAAIKKCVNL